MAVCLIGASPALAAEDAAEVASVQGEVYAHATGGQERACRAGQVLKLGTWVRTGPSGSATINLGGGIRMELRASSRIQLSNRRRRKQFSVSLLFGRLWSQVSNLAGTGETFEVATHNAVAGVRGTVFEMGVRADGYSKLRVGEGGVSASGLGGERVIQANQEVEITEAGLGRTMSFQGDDWGTWEAAGEARLRAEGAAVATGMAKSARRRKEQMKKLRQTQKNLQQKLGDQATPAAERTALGEQLGKIEGNMRRVTDQVGAQNGLVDKLVSYANDPGFGMSGADVMGQQAGEIRNLGRETSQMARDGLSQGSPGGGGSQLVPGSKLGKTDRVKKAKKYVKVMQNQVADLLVLLEYARQEKKPGAISDILAKLEVATRRASKARKLQKRLEEEDLTDEESEQLYDDIASEMEEVLELRDEAEESTIDFGPAAETIIEIQVVVPPEGEVVVEAEPIIIDVRPPAASPYQLRRGE